MELTMAGALNAALRDSMRDDDSVVVYGEDVGKLGGVFRITDGLQAEMGIDRCFDTPVAESGIAGTAMRFKGPKFARSTSSPYCWDKAM